MANANTQAIQVVQGLVSASQQLMALYNLMVTLDAQWTDQSVATIVAAMATVTQNADGTQGASDGSPNVAHPINLTTYPSMPRSISSNQVGQLKTILDGIVNYVGGQAVSTQTGARAILNAAVGG
jgi:hypothetical protein